MEVWESINNPEIRACESSLTECDLVVIRDVERALSDGLNLKHWWEQKEALGKYAEEFEFVRTYNRASRVTGFFDSTLLNGRNFPLTGLVQEMLFDESKQASPEKVRDELREFILHYFLRVSSFRLPDAYVGRDQPTKTNVRKALQPFSLCPEPQDPLAGFGYSQLYYKLRESGYIGKFPAHLQPRIVDLRRLDDIYEWIVLQVNLFNFNLSYTPFADGLFTLRFPQEEEIYIAISRDFIKNQTDPSLDLLGRYGLGYALLKPAPRKTIFAYGPGEFEAGFQLIDFEISKKGQSCVRMAFVSNRPVQITRIDLNLFSAGVRIADLMTFGLASRVFRPTMGFLEQLSPRIGNLDPVGTYITLVNLLTGGMAQNQLCASIEALEKNPMLLTHFMEHYNLIAGALMTWRHVQSWLNADDVPRAVREGTSS